MRCAAMWWIECHAMWHNAMRAKRMRCSPMQTMLCYVIWLGPIWSVWCDVQPDPGWYDAAPTMQAMRSDTIICNAIWYNQYTTMPHNAIQCIRWNAMFCNFLQCNCNMTTGQPCLSLGTLDVLVILFGIRACSLDALVILFSILWHYFVNQWPSNVLLSSA